MPGSVHSQDQDQSMLDAEQQAPAPDPVDPITLEEKHIVVVRSFLSSNFSSTFFQLHHLPKKERKKETKTDRYLSTPLQLPGSTETAASFQFDGEGHTLGNALRYAIMKKWVLPFHDVRVRLERAYLLCPEWKLQKEKRISAHLAQSRCRVLRIHHPASLGGEDASSYSDYWWVLFFLLFSLPFFFLCQSSQPILYAILVLTITLQTQPPPSKPSKREWTNWWICAMSWRRSSPMRGISSTRNRVIGWNLKERNKKRN